MVGASKILTVSYGTFSCTLEGFDDSFETMKAIAEYFRDLAADDRYFGAEPPSPDAEMLQRIAEREIHKRVDAQVSDDRIVLRADPQERAPLPQPPVHTAAPAPVAQPEFQQPAPMAAAHPAAAPDGDPGSVAAKLARIRAVVGAARAAPAPVQTFEEDFDATPAAPEPAQPFVAAEPVEDVAEADLQDTIEAAPAPVADDSVADDSIADDSIEEIEEEVTDHDDADLEDVPDADMSFEQADDGTHEEIADIADDLADDVEDIEDMGLLEETAEDTASFDGADDIYEIEDTSISTTPAAVAFDTDDQAPEQDDDDTSILSLVTQDLNDADAIDADDDEQTDVLAVEEEDADDTGSVIQLSDLDEASEFDIPDDPFAAGNDDAEEALTTDAVDHDDAAEEEDDTTIAALGLDLDAITEPADEDADSDQDTAEEDSDPTARGGRKAGSDAALRAAARARARVLMVKGAELQDDDTGLDSGELSPEGEADLQAHLADDDETADVPPAPTSVTQLRAGALEQEEAAVSRLMDEANTKLEGPENKRRRSAIAHLKAAVAATVAERRLKPRDKTKEEEAEKDPYRQDLAQVVRSSTQGRADGDEAGQRPEKPLAPLMLVSEQRVDTSPSAAHSDVAGDLSSVRPRRVTKGNLALQQDDFPEQAEDDENLFVDAESFAEYAEQVGARELGDMLEAAAAYAHENGGETVSRPQVMRTVQEFVGEESFSREEGLRAFGTLLREGKIEKVKRGQFTISKTSRFNTEERD